MMQSTRLVLLAILLSGVSLFSGCEHDETAALELTQDQIELEERDACRRLRKLGCVVSEAEDQWIGTSGIMVRLAPEHISEDGTIRFDVLSEFRRLRRLFLIVDRTPIKAVGLGQLRQLNNLLLLSAQTTMTDDEGLSQIHGIVSLRLLRLNRTLISDKSLRHIERLPELKLLYVSHSLLTDKAMEHIGELSKLTSLQLGNTRLTDKGVTRLIQLPALTHLALDGTDITDKSVPVLLQLKKLKYLSVDQTKLSDAGVQQLIEGLPDCHIECVILEPSTQAQIEQD